MSIKSALESPFIVKTLEWLIVFWLFVFAIFAPHSIAITQAAWLLGMVCWLLRLTLYPRPKLRRSPVDYVLLGFFIITGLSAVLSYEPLVSIGKLRAASLFTIVYLFVENIPSRRVARSLALALIASCLINVLYTAITRVVGKGVKIEGVAAQSPLSAATMTSLQRTQERFPIISSDTILTVDGYPVRAADEIANLLTADPQRHFATLTFYRGDVFPPVRVPRGRLLPGNTAEQQLGISAWHIGRDWRASGFYGHYVTYAEALQLIASLALGLYICLPFKRGWYGLALLIALAGLVFALLLTVTRASWLAFLISGCLMLLLGTSRRMILLAAACAIPLVLAGAFVLQQKRHVGLIDQKDASITWRETVWREGFHLLVSNPRHLLVGVGMDSIKERWRQWGLFDRGRIPIGHMHSNLLEIALERGLPALLLWLMLLGVYARSLLQAFRKLSREQPNGEGGWLASWVDRGIVLGALGGLAGFFVSGLVHYNWGDSEVVMIFYLIMALSLAVGRSSNLNCFVPPVGS
jgi:O-Antigen ligase